ncbi:carbohydrate-binding family 9-like protein [Paenibacillus sacheonensis]|uniref:Carbohydrate-binding domain-containing protein n=1 Tax=Paenibacillus sacheonensis TaxID=742054 RepID=A0A7X4YU41_9BACL|nr:carbohydrate-binding family 9-like protein [Paenibacillus sacheonensis]MBM7568891.1 hypothetical protein [Paenibacillus sacheonensis]NBC72593.1 hypothetical protein [Paenibacillus sacheonensis]
MPHYSCRKINADLQIDGDLDKAEWQLAERVQLTDAATGASPIQRTEAKLLWNDRYLYVAFECQDDYVRATMQGFNDKLYEEEVVEIFIDDDGDPRTYIEIELNPLNACLHYSVHNPLRGRILTYARTEMNLVTAVRHDTERSAWTAELAIPLTEFVTAQHCPPLPGDEWRFNLYRIDRPRDGSIEFSAWSPPGEPQFHKPLSFGGLRFTEE